MGSMTDWRTPFSLFNYLKQVVGENGFAIDAAADSSNHLCDRWYGPGSIWGTDALAEPKWMSPAWCNPPYSRSIDQWIFKMNEQADLGATIVALLPAKVETKWWYEGIVAKKRDIYFLVGRVPFDPPPSWAAAVDSPKFPSAVVLFAPATKGRIMWWDWKEEV